MKLEKGERLVTVLPQSNMWIVCVRGLAGWRVERANLLAVTLQRSPGGHREMTCTYLTLSGTGLGDPIPMHALDGAIGVFEAPSSDAAIQAAQHMIKIDPGLEECAASLRATLLERRAGLAKAVARQRNAAHRAP